MRDAGNAGLPRGKCVSLNMDKDGPETMREAVARAMDTALRAMESDARVSELTNDEVRAIADAAIRTVLERLREPTPEMITAGREAFLKDMRDRRLLKWLFAENPENHADIGYVDRPIDAWVQDECANESTGKSFAAMLDAAVREVG